MGGASAWMKASATRTLLLAAVVGAFAAVSIGYAADGRATLVPSWAKVNVCSPTQLGVRAQLAGDGTAGDMRARFTAQWLSPTGWVPVGGAAGSPWQSAGSAEFTWGQAGWTFQLDPPLAGQSYVLRGVAELAWPDGASETRVTGPCRVS